MIWFILFNLSLQTSSFKNLEIARQLESHIKTKFIRIIPDSHRLFNPDSHGFIAEYSDGSKWYIKNQLVTDFRFVSQLKMTTCKSDNFNLMYIYANPTDLLHYVLFENIRNFGPKVEIIFNSKYGYGLCNDYIKNRGKNIRSKDVVCDLYRGVFTATRDVRKSINEECTSPLSFITDVNQSIDNSFLQSEEEIDRIANKFVKIAEKCNLIQDIFIFLFLSNVFGIKDCVIDHRGNPSNYGLLYQEDDENKEEDNNFKVFNLSPGHSESLMGIMSSIKRNESKGHPFTNSLSPVKKTQQQQQSTSSHLSLLIENNQLIRELKQGEQYKYPKKDSKRLFKLHRVDEDENLNDGEYTQDKHIKNDQYSHIEEQGGLYTQDKHIKNDQELSSRIKDQQGGHYTLDLKSQQGKSIEKQGNSHFVRNNEIIHPQFKTIDHLPYDNESLKLCYVDFTRDEGEKSKSIIDDTTLKSESQSKKESSSKKKQHFIYKIYKHFKNHTIYPGLGIHRIVQKLLSLKSVLIGLEEIFEPSKYHLLKESISSSCGYISQLILNDNNHYYFKESVSIGYLNNYCLLIVGRLDLLKKEYELSLNQVREDEEEFPELSLLLQTIPSVQLALPERKKGVCDNCEGCLII